MNEFLEIHKLPRLIYEEIENLNKSVTSKEIKSIIENFPAKKSPGPDGFTGDFYQTLTEKLKPILLKPFQKTEEKGTLPNSFYEASFTLTPKPDKDITLHLVVYTNIPDKYRCKNS